MRNRWMCVVLLSAAMLMAHAASAQENCQALKALTQATIVIDPASLPPSLASHVGEPGFAWGGQVFAAVGSTGMPNVMAIEYQRGWFYGKDDSAGQSIYGKANGRGRDGLYMFAFGTYDGETWNITDGFTVQLGQAVWTPNPAGMGVGYYQASGKLVDGYGRFAGATGSFTLQGDFVGWSIPEFPGFVAAWNPALMGKFCK